MKYTPTPYTTYIDEEKNLYCFRNANEEHFMTMDSPKKGTIESTANFIVSACNNNQKLIESLKALIRRSKELELWTKSLDIRLLKQAGLNPETEPELGELCRIREAREQAEDILNNMQKNY